MPEAESAKSHPESCRAIAARARSATLATIARDPAGFPYASLVAVTVDSAGRPLLLLSRLAEHTRNLEERADASILLTEPSSPGADGGEGASEGALALGRVTLLGRCAPVPEPDRAAARETFLAAHADAARYADFADFALYRLEPIALRYVGGFGRMSWVDAAAYAAVP